MGADVLADTYFIEDKANFTDVGILAKVGYIFGSVEKKVDFYGLFKYGVDLQCYEDKYSAVQTFGHQIGLECFVSDRWSLTGAVEVLFATPKKNDVQYFNIRCNPYIGMCYSY